MDSLWMEERTCVKAITECADPDLPALQDDQSRLGMGLGLDRSARVQLLPSSQTLWGLDRLDQQSLPLNQAYQ